MSSDCYCRSPLNVLNAITAFMLTAIVCAGFLISVENLRLSSGAVVVPTIELAPLHPLDLPAIPIDPIAFVADGVCVSPEMAWILDDACCTETAPVIPDTIKLQKKGPFQGIIVQVAGRYQVDPHLIRAIIFAESGFNPRAKSKKGALGLMQLMPSTAKALGVQDVYDPAENIEGGVRYFKSLLDRFDGDVQLALAAYNAGSRHVRNYEGIPPFKATRHYIKKVLKFQKKFKMETASLARRLV